MNGCAGRALPSIWLIQSSQTMKIDHSSPSKAAGGRAGRVVGFLDDGWRVAGKLRTNRCEEATFLQIEKLQSWRLKGERRVGCRRQIRPPQGNFRWNGVRRRDWWNGMGVGGVKGGHRIKVCEALDLVTFLTGLLNSRLCVITMENPKDTINS
jgi:hypothetical protein